MEPVQFGQYPPARRTILHLSDTHLLAGNPPLGGRYDTAANLARTATKFKCDIMIEKDGETVNAKSIMGLMMLAAGPGTKLTVHATGADASAALGELDALAKRKFDVPED